MSIFYFNIKRTALKPCRAPEKRNLRFNNNYLQIKLSNKMNIDST